ncbi:MAG TPA: PBP1A family penicillin-binding protein [Lachnospiraceae bacterium]|nr:PBP1A family penicillin-binding protein [Lachnospiraceae bacterium]
MNTSNNNFNGNNRNANDFGRNANGNRSGNRNSFSNANGNGNPFGNSNGNAYGNGNSYSNGSPYGNANVSGNAYGGRNSNSYGNSNQYGNMNGNAYAGRNPNAGRNMNNGRSVNNGRGTSTGRSMNAGSGNAGRNMNQGSYVDESTYGNVNMAKGANLSGTQTRNPNSSKGRTQSQNKSSKKPQNRKSKKEAKIAKRKAFKKKHPILNKLKFVFKIFLLFCCVVTLGLGLLFYNKYGKNILQMQADAKKLVRESSLDTFRQTETSIVYDTNGDELSVLKGEKDVYYIDFEDIPQYAIDAFITIEDKKFMKHNGIDLWANVRAVVALVKNKGAITQGASTITQQLSRNVFLSHEVTWQRKVEEMFIAMELEKKYTKWQILEFYLNNIYFANGYYGIQAASYGYFSKDVNELTLAEITFLCSIPNNPTIYDPVDNYDNTLKRQDRILSQMLEDGKISSDEYNEAKAQKVELKLKKTKVKDYVETYVYYSAVRALMKESGFTFRNEFDSEEDRKDYNERYNQLYDQCQLSLYSEGYRIYTSIDMKQQKLLQKSVDDALAQFKEKNKDGIYELQSSAVCIDNSNGLVTAIVGGRKQKTAGYTLNRAFQSYRQPGSAIKPLIVYTPSLENGHYPEEIVNDKKFEGGPSNSNGVYSGKITLRQAVENSKNTVAWKLFEELTPKVGLRYLTRMNFAKLDPNDYYPAASLGGFTYGVSAVEMASAYSTLENDGIYREPTCIVKITDAEGNIIVSSEKNDYQVYETNSARMMTNILEGVIERGTARGLSIPNIASAGKTGTTNERKDGWFVGYTPYYTTSVWVGYDIPRKLDGLMGSTYPGQIWHNFMLSLHEGLPQAKFEAYIDEHKSTDQPIEEDVEEQAGAVEENATQDQQVDTTIPEDTKEDDDTAIEDPLEEENPDDISQDEEEDTVPVEDDSDVPVEDPNQDVQEPDDGTDDGSTDGNVDDVTGGGTEDSGDANGGTQSTDVNVQP